MQAGNSLFFVSLSALKEKLNFEILLAIIPSSKCEIDDGFLYSEFQ
ncbi:MAG: hypothetical protein ACI92O_002817 [Colwellia sp.]|jgi:hypothetical protein|tara:strand:+ start:4081 stop:4218 length:138 start_codon:yes stop_codon:yes gene_type:complete